ncbi:hypothetical protein [Pseudomonas helleri]|uniref:hypothetical protein n=1 Tax=Pseudomonas helleri TaxID=1608996 RepID=UPI003CC89BD8
MCHQLEKSDAIIVGSPTSNDSISARFKQFFEDSAKAAKSRQALPTLEHRSVK